MFGKKKKSSPHQIVITHLKTFFGMRAAPEYRIRIEIVKNKPTNITAEKLVKSTINQRRKLVLCVGRKAME